MEAPNVIPVPPVMIITVEWFPQCARIDDPNGPSMYVLNNTPLLICLPRLLSGSDRDVNG